MHNISPFGLLYILQGPGNETEETASINLSDESPQFSAHWSAFDSGMCMEQLFNAILLFLSDGNLVYSVSAVWRHSDALTCLALMRQWDNLLMYLNVFFPVTYFLTYSVGTGGTNSSNSQPAQIATIDLLGTELVCSLGTDSASKESSQDGNSICNSNNSTQHQQFQETIRATQQFITELHQNDALEAQQRLLILEHNRFKILSSFLQLVFSSSFSSKADMSSSSVSASAFAMLEVVIPWIYDLRVWHIRSTHTHTHTHKHKHTHTHVRIYVLLTYRHYYLSTG